MPQLPFIHLKVRTPYSLAEGAIRIPEILKWCQKHDMPAVGICDTNNLFGALEFSLAAAKAGVQPVIGAQVQFIEGSLFLYAQNEAGYLNLMHLMQRYYLQHEGQLPLVELEGHNDGLLCLAGGPGTVVGDALLAKNPGDALSTVQGYFDDRLYIELRRHDLPEELELEPKLIALANEHTLPLVAVNDVYYTDQSMQTAHDALLCIAQGATVSAEERRHTSAHFRLKTADEMAMLYEDVPEAISNTALFARRAAYMPQPRNPILPSFSDGAEAEDLEKQSKIGLEERLEKYVMPTLVAEYTKLANQVRHPEQQCDSAASSKDLYSEISPSKDPSTATSIQDASAQDDGVGVERGTYVLTAEQKVEIEASLKQYRDRLAWELRVINDMGFPGYFLIVSDFIKWAKAHNIPVGPGRGSGAGSIVAWALSITDLDPIKLNLLFERFLNPERVSMPDFDVDFCQERRDEVITYVQQKYGDDRVAQIITFGKLQARAALRDVGRVLELPYGQVDRICKMIPFNPANPVTLQEAIDSEPQLKELQRAEDTGPLLDTGLKLEGLYRHASTHAAGVVIGDRPLQELIPLYRDPRSPMPVTQFNMKYAETAGLVKFDFLGLKTLTVLQTAVDTIKELMDKDIDLLALDMEDEKTFKMLSRGDASGVFQLESAGMRDVLRQLQPDRFEDIIAVVALYRPGPMDNIPQYISYKHGREEVVYLHDKLKGILQETFGIMIYQEQVMQAAQILAGYSLGGADLLRRAMGKKIKAEMDSQRSLFVQGCKEHNNISKADADRIFDQIAKFAGYGFNKSHAAAYALVSYQTAYLKANYPVFLMAALMTHDLQNTDKLALFVQELKRLEITLLLPDVNESVARYKVVPHEGANHGGFAIRYALAAIKGVGEAAMEALVAEREANGPYKSLFNVVERLQGKGVNKRLLENLAAAGAFDSLHENRAAVLASIPMAIEMCSGGQADANQDSLFGDALPSMAQNAELVEAASWGNQDKLAAEQKAVGFYLSSHPLDSYQATLENLEVTPSAELAERRGRVQLAGVMLAKKEKRSQKGSKFAFVQFSDSTGIYEAMLFSEGLAQYRELLESGQPVLVDVDVDVSDRGQRLTCQRVQALEDAEARVESTVELTIDSVEQLEQFQQALADCRPGKTTVEVTMSGNNGVELLLVLPGRYQLGQGFRDKFVV